MEKKIERYLKKTGIDILLSEAFNELIICKPENPIEFIATYLEERA